MGKPVEIRSGDWRTLALDGIAAALGRGPQGDQAEAPDALQAGFDAWVAAGATVVTAPTLMVLDPMEVGEVTAELVCRRDELGVGVLVGASIGPPGVVHDRADELARAAVGAGADELVLPTITDRAVVERALQLAADLPIRCLISLSPLPGQPAETTRWMHDLEPPATVAIGLNCMSGRAGLDSIVEAFAGSWGDLVLQPSAGVPPDHTDPRAWASALLSIADRHRLHRIGGCCGVTPSHLRAVREFGALVPNRREDD